MRKRFDPGPIVLGVSVAVISALIMIGVIALVATQQDRQGSLGANSRAQHVMPK